MPDFKGYVESEDDDDGFSNHVASVFKNKRFIDKVTDTLFAAINEAVTKVVTSLEEKFIKPLRDENKTLRLKVKETDEIIKQTKN